MAELVMILGAGASHQAVPIIKDFKTKLQEFADYLKTESHVIRLDWSQKEQETIPEILKLLEFHQNQSSSHVSIDTYARKLDLSKETKSLRDLKIILSLFLVWCQTQTDPDQRYDSLMASMLVKDTHLRMPNNLKLLSWNYDFQVSLSYLRYESSNVGLEYILSYENRTKLNGLCLPIPIGRDPENFVNLISPIDQNITKNLIDYYRRLNFDLLSSLDETFGFSFEEKHQEIVLDSFGEIDTANAVVAIGYSFPFYNRHIDSLLLKRIRKTTPLYVQVLKEHFDTIYNSIKTMNPELHKIEHIHPAETFFIPHSYYPI